MHLMAIFGKMTFDAPSARSSHYPPHSSSHSFLSLIFGVFFFFFWHDVALSSSPSPVSSILSAPDPPFSLMSSHSNVSRSTKTKRTGKRALRPGCKRASLVHVSDDEPAPAKGAQHVQWNNNRTDRLIEWLEENPQDRQ